MAIVRREKRQRGFFGWVFLLMFIAFNLLMVLWIGSYWSTLAERVATSDAEQVGKAIGGTIGTGMLLTLWAIGDIILGIFVLLSRGQKIIIEELA